MKASDVRKSSLDELQTLLQELLKEQFNLRMQRGTGQLSRPSQLQAVKRDIARIKTIMTEKKTGGGQ